jgi:hypothetical protein
VNKGRPGPLLKIAISLWRLGCEQGFEVWRLPPTQGAIAAVGGGLSRGWPQESNEQEHRQDEQTCKAQGRSRPGLEDHADVGWDRRWAHASAVLRFTKYGDASSRRLSGWGAVNKLNLMGVLASGGGSLPIA